MQFQMLDRLPSVPSWRSRLPDWPPDDPHPIVTASQTPDDPHPIVTTSQTPDDPHPIVTTPDDPHPIVTA